MPRHSLEQRKQVMMWYYEGNAYKKVAELFNLTYKGGTANSCSIYNIIERFEQRGCFHLCPLCKGVVKDSEKNEKKELEEIMVCAAAEMELSIRDIAKELGVGSTKVFQILKKNGYSASSELPQDDTDDVNENMDTEDDYAERKQIIKWHCMGHSLDEMTELLIKVNGSKEPKDYVQLVIDLYDKYSCIQNCKKCIEKAHKTPQTKRTAITSKIIHEKNEYNVDMVEISKTEVTELDYLTS